MQSCPAPKQPDKPRLSLPELLALARAVGKPMRYRTVYLAAIEGDLPAAKVNGRYMVARHDAETYLGQL